jgi:hypothetical protein
MIICNSPLDSCFAPERVVTRTRCEESVTLLTGATFPRRRSLESVCEILVWLESTFPPVKRSGFGDVAAQVGIVESRRPLASRDSRVVAVNASTSFAVALKRRDCRPRGRILGRGAIADGTVVGFSRGSGCIASQRAANRPDVRRVRRVVVVKAGAFHDVLQFLDRVVGNDTRCVALSVGVVVIHIPGVPRSTAWRLQFPTSIRLHTVGLGILDAFGRHDD